MTRQSPNKSNKSSVIVLEHLNKVYGQGDFAVQALYDVNLNINSGELVAIMGPSGSGKSTLMNIIGCLDEPTSGKCIISGMDISGLNEEELSRLRGVCIGFIFQRHNLLPRLTALDNVALPLMYQGWDIDSRRERAVELLKKVGLTDRINHRPTELSGGQNQRVAIARALACNPAIILADEPTGALDSKTTGNVMDLLLSLNSEGRTIVIVTHDEKLGSRCPRMVKILDGRLTQ